MGKGNPDGGRADSGVTDGSLDDDVKEPPHMRLVEIQFAARAGTVVADCAGTYTLGTPPAQVRIEDFRLYVSNFRLVDGAGTEHPITLMTDEKWQDINTALLDFEDGTGTCSENTTPDTNSVVRGWTTAASQTALRFTLGVPHEQNHRLPTSATPPLTVGAMFWSWQAGYKFLRLDLKQIDPPETSWLIHVGSHNCQSASPAEPPTTLCGRPNRAEISLSPFDPNSNVVVVDVAALVSASDLTTNTPETGPGCMSESDDPDCAAIFTNLGIDFATGSCADECTGQTFFRVE